MFLKLQPCRYYYMSIKLTGHQLNARLARVCKSLQTASRKGRKGFAKHAKSIQQKCPAAFEERLHILLYALLDRSGILAGFHRFNYLSVADEKTARLEVDFAGVKFLQSVSQLQSKPH